MRPCRCTPEVPDPKVRAVLGTPGICLYNPGRTEEEALANLRLHAKKDRVPRSRWVECWIEKLTGEFVRDVPLEELKGAK